MGPYAPGDSSVPPRPLLKPPGCCRCPSCSPALASCGARFASSHPESSASSSRGPAASPSRLGEGQLRKHVQNAVRFWPAPLRRGAQAGCSHPRLGRESPREKLGSRRAPRVSATGPQGLVTASGDRDLGQGTRHPALVTPLARLLLPLPHADVALPGRLSCRAGRKVHVLFLAPRQSRRRSSTARGKELGSNHGSRC